jgi:hypothetical protein
MKTYEKLDFSQAPNMPKGYPSELQALAAAEALEPKMKATAREASYGWTVDIDDGEGSIGSIVQNDSLLWWCGGERFRRQMEVTRR